MTKRFGKLLGQGISSVARRQEITMRAVQEKIGEQIGVGPDMISYWIKGNVPEPERVELLTRYCIENGHVNQAWAQSLLTQARYPDRDRLLEKLFVDHLLGTRIFISFKGSSQPDEDLATQLQRLLTAQDYETFISDITQSTDTWPEKMDQQTKAGDLFVVLLSKNSVESEITQALIGQADEYRQQWGWLRILPVRVAYMEALPYLIDSFLNPRQYVVWHDKSDNDLVVQEIVLASRGRLPNKEPIQAQLGLEVSEDGSLIIDNSKRLSPPLPQFDPRGLESPEGAVKLRDNLYIRRDADPRLENQVVGWGTTTTIRAPRQTGKSSLLIRGLRYARRSGGKTVRLDMQTVSREDRISADRFLFYLAKFIVRNLRLDDAVVEKAWRSSLGPYTKLSHLLEDYVLPTSRVPMTLALDEADRLLTTDFSQDFFSLVRSWHNQRADNEVWDKLNLVLVISTEPYLLIRDLDQSPFNVGFKLYLEDFDLAQVRDLNQRHGSPLHEPDLPRLITLLNGHPYLTRKALYILVTEQLHWDDLVAVADKDQGPFGDHLWHNYLLLRDDQSLRNALRQIIGQARCTNEMAFTRLLRAGLVKGSSEGCTCRCELYRMYFDGKL